jgi:hypothetical protein
MSVSDISNSALLARLRDLERTLQRIIGAHDPFGESTATELPAGPGKENTMTSAPPEDDPFASRPGPDATPAERLRWNSQLRRKLADEYKNLGKLRRARRTRANGTSSQPPETPPGK